ncbi:hypothetical protein [Sediminibacter sp. Hel_I_10]|uniref:hypothetical protein n=1 Tax=Sediminibacter sp. Hel_I_10 TaxID=1392490 RepID=UPI00047DD340|nr:hypothetical protein [Sediminibacter sp. Hel_I_10]
MNRFLKILALGTLALLMATSCSEDDENTAVAEVVPMAASLIYPENNTECNEGVVISDTETDVLFQWEEVPTAFSYVLQITNLNDGVSRNISTNSNEFLIRIFRGTPYSWSVKSLFNGTNDTSESDVWRFYNAGLPQETHPPFPAEVVYPQSGASIDQGVVPLQWEASDIDNDIASYQILLDTTTPPSTEIGVTSNTQFEIEVSSGQVYYWKVLTTDGSGNISNSQIFQFSVN